jgi:hypothetical protein
VKLGQSWNQAPADVLTVLRRVTEEVVAEISAHSSSTWPVLETNRSRDCI